MSSSNPVKRVAALVGGGIVLLVGIALLILPGPGLLLVLGGLLILANEFQAIQKYVDPVRTRALKATEESVSSPLRIAGSVLAGLLLIAAGIFWGLNKWLWLGGWPTGSSLILSGVVLLVLLGFSYHRVRTGQTVNDADNDLTHS
jgi:hypothetical protein